MRLLRDALRQLRSAPGVSLLAVITLGVGIGATTALFSVVDAVLLRALPFDDPGRLVRVVGTDPTRRSGNLSPLDVVDFREQGRSLEVAALSQGSMVVSGAGIPSEVRSAVATANLFEVLHAAPSLGRLFAADEETSGRHRVALLSHALWVSRFASDRAIVGQTLTLDGAAYVVAGVLPEGFRSPVWDPRGEPEIWRPLPVPRDPGARGGHWLSGIARLREGATLSGAQQEMDALAALLAKTYPNTNQGRGVVLAPLDSATVAGVRPALVTLLQAVGLLLAVACANVAGLLLARASAREREIAIRRALGASAGRIVKQLLAEGALVGALAGVVGIAIASWGTQLVVKLAADSIPRASTIAVDGRVLAFAIVVSLLTGVLAGLAPALRLSRPDLVGSIKVGATVEAPAGRAQRTRRILVVAQTALAVVLLSTAGLFLKSLWRLGAVEPGFASERVLTGEVSVPRAKAGDAALAGAMLATILDRIATLPGVSAAGGVNILPLGGGYSCDSFTIAEHPPIAPADEPCAEARIASPGYFDAMAIPVRRGRGLHVSDGERSQPVLVIDEAFAREFFPGEDPLGKHVVYNAAPREIVGIVGSVHHFGPASEAPAEFYLPLAQQPLDGLAIALRTGPDPMQLAAPLRAAVAEVDPDLAVIRIRTMEELLERSEASPRFRSILVSSFASIALVLALIGTYGLTAYAVGRRTREIAVRSALGARRGEVVSLFLREGLRLSATGLLLGLPLAALAARAVAGMLFRVEPIDAWVLATVCVVLCAGALLACYLPARRAAGIDPARALRGD